MKDSIAPQPEPPADDPDPDASYSPWGWGHISDDEDGSTWELHQDEGTFPPGL